MRLMGRIVRIVGALLWAIDAAIAVVKFMVILFAALVGLAVVAAGVAAYLKREQWTKPAYRWARDRSGRWTMTPWSPAGSGAAEPDAVVKPTSADEGAS